MHDDGFFDADVAARYDQDPACRDEVVTPIVDRLAELAQGARALEFAVGTGRIAVPLAARGIEVHGIELSRAMLAKLNEKPGGERVTAVVGDMASARVAGSFGLVYLVYNTIMNLTTQAAQVACFRNAAAHLAPGGCFVVEVLLPRLQRLNAGEVHHVFHASAAAWGIDAYDIATQGLVSHHVWREGGELKQLDLQTRYVWPAELDLMAELAGLRLRSRWSDWDGAPFTSASEQHVSVWERPA